MTSDELRLMRLAGQHLLAPADTRTVVHDLCGVQAQFLGHARHGLAIRGGSGGTDGLCKSWTIRGTMHVFSEDDLPLFLHEGRTHFLCPVDTMESDDDLTAQRKAYFAELLEDSIAQGTDEREALKAVCERAGMTERESRSVFDPWGGLLRAMSEAGRICQNVQEKKTYRLCPAFEPMAEAAAREELLRRYFTNFGPATVRDAAYFFGWTQTKVRAAMAGLPLAELTLDGEMYYRIGEGIPDAELPESLFLAGFDQLMLGYEKTKSPFLPPEHVRDIFTRAGFVRPALLVRGTVAGWWNRKGNRLTVTLFGPADRAMIGRAARALWPELKDVEFA